MCEHFRQPSPFFYFFSGYFAAFEKARSCIGADRGSGNLWSVSPPPPQQRSTAAAANYLLGLCGQISTSCSLPQQQKAHAAWTKSEHLDSWLRFMAAQKTASGTAVVYWTPLTWSWVSKFDDTHLGPFQHFPFVENFHGVNFICFFQLYNSHLKGRRCHWMFIFKERSKLFKLDLRHLHRCNATEFPWKNLRKFYYSPQGLHSFLFCCCCFFFDCWCVWISVRYLSKCSSSNDFQGLKVISLKTQGFDAINNRLHWNRNSNYSISSCCGRVVVKDCFKSNTGSPTRASLCPSLDPKLMDP